MTGHDWHPVLAAAAGAAVAALADAELLTPDERSAIVAMGADGTPTMRVDQELEDRILAAVIPLGANVLSEEAGFIDTGSALTMVVDPLDGSANAAAGVPLACFSAALAEDGRFVEGLTIWLATGQAWWARAGGSSNGLGVTGCKEVKGSAVSLLRPHGRDWPAWSRIAERAGRIRVLGSSTLDAAFVAAGAVDAFVDPGSDTHRLVDLAAALVLVPAAGGVVVDAFARPIELDLDLTRRWSGVCAASAALAEELCRLVATESGETLD